jgi:type II secretory pathway component PulF
VQVFRTMGTLVQSGVGVLDTLELARGSTRNSRFRRLFDEMHDAVTSGGQLSTAFEHSGVIDPSICQAVHTGEDSGNLGEALTYCADVLDETNAELISTLVKLVEPAILILMGLVIGCVAVSLFLPLFDMTSALR